MRYAAEGFYPGTIFHRVVKGFVIQGGGYMPGMVEKPTHEPIQNEATNGLKNSRGTLAMARTQTLRSATSQFYINVSNNSALDHRGYAPLGFRLCRLRPRAERHGGRRQDRRGCDQGGESDRAGHDQECDREVGWFFRLKAEATQSFLETPRGRFLQRKAVSENRSFRLQAEDQRTRAITSRCSRSSRRSRRHFEAVFVLIARSSRRMS